MPIIGTVNPFLTMAWRGPPQLGTLGRPGVSVAEQRSHYSAPSVAGRSRVSSYINVAVMMSKALNAKFGMVFIAALAASAIDAFPAVAGPERLAHVLVSEVTQPPLGSATATATSP